MRKLLVLTLLLLALPVFARTVVMNAFNSGELSPLLEGRTDVKKYYSGCRTLENMVVLPHGGVTKRPGSYYIASAKSGSVACRLIPFEFSTTQAYIIELGHLYARFYRNGGQIEDAGSPYEIVTPYDGNDLFGLQFVQSADTMYFTHNTYPPCALTRTGHTAWTIPEVTFERGPFLDENETDTTIDPTGTTGSISLSSSASLFNANHVGALWQIMHTVAAAEVSGSFTATSQDSSDATVQKGRKYDFTTHGTWTGTVLLQRSYDAGSIWKDVISFHNEGDGNISYSDEEDIEDAIYQMVSTGTWTGTCNYNLLVRSFDVKGVVDITNYISDTNVTGTVTYTLGAATATKYWAEGAWSPDEGYPACVAFYEERQGFAATNNKPQTLWFSQTDDWTNMLIGSDDTDAMALTIAADQVNAIKWLVPQTALLIGTTGGEWELSATGADEPLTPTNVGAKRQSSYGSASVQAIAMNNIILFLQRQSQKVRKLQYSFELDNWIAPDLTLLSEHITGDGITCWALQKNPYPILWAVTTGGTLIGLTLEESNEVLGWHTHDLGADDVESVAVIAGSAEDEVWVSAERTIDSAIVRYVEQLQPFDWGSAQRDCFFVDSGLTYDGGASQSITDITQANPAVITVSTWPTKGDADATDMADDDQIRIVSVSGMTELNNNVYTVDDADSVAKTFSLNDSTNAVNINSTNFTAYTSDGTVEICENVFTTLNHLEGETVLALTDGGYGGSYTVTSNTVTLGDFYNTVHIGLGFTAKLQPMKLEAAAQPGVLFGIPKRVTEVTLRFHESLGCKVGTSWTTYDSYVFRDADDALETATPLYSDDKTIPFSGDYETAGDIYIQSDTPVPLTILGLMAEYEAYP